MRVNRDGRRDARPVPLEKLLARLPRGRDRDVLELLSQKEPLRQRGVAALFNVSQPAVASQKHHATRRLAIIARHATLLVDASAQRKTVTAVRAAGWTSRAARYLWWLFWTTSPREARVKVGISAREGGRALARLLGGTVPDPDVQRLRAGLACVRELGWGCLWGRLGQKALPGGTGHRYVEGVAEVIDLVDQRRRVLRTRPREPRRRRRSAPLPG